MKVSLSGGWRELRSSIAGERKLRVSCEGLRVGDVVEVTLTLPSGISVELPAVAVEALERSRWLIEIAPARLNDFTLLSAMVEAEAARDSERQVLEREKEPRRAAPAATPPQGLPPLQPRHARAPTPVPTPVEIELPPPAPAPTPAPPTPAPPIEIAFEPAVLPPMELETPFGRASEAAPDPSDDDDAGFDIDVGSMPSSMPRSPPPGASLELGAVAPYLPAPAAGLAPLDLGLLAPPALDFGGVFAATPVAAAPMPAPVVARPPAVAPVPVRERVASVLDAPTTGAPLVLATIARPSREAELPDERPSGGPVLGIDYGTCNASVAIMSAGKVRLAADAQGRRTMPCLLHVDSKGNVATGWAAKDALATDPGRTVGSVKRVLGRPATELEVANWVASRPFPTETLPNGAIALHVGGRPFSVPQIATELLGALKRQAEAALGTAATDVVLAVPVAFETAQRNALRQAARFAGLRVIGLIPEPVAAGLAAGVGRQQREVVAVFDFGGGTFDFCLLEAQGERLRPMAIAGEPWLGGDDFDLVLATEVATDFFGERKIQLQHRAVEWTRLLHECEAAKQRLTDASETTVELAEVASTAKGPIDLAIAITRKRFTQLGKPLIGQAIGVVTESLEKARVEPRHVARVILTGGMSRMPGVREELARVFGRPLEDAPNAEEAVALGAALQGLALARAGRGRAAPRT